MSDLETSIRGNKPFIILTTFVLQTILTKLVQFLWVKRIETAFSSFNLKSSPKLSTAHQVRTCKWSDCILLRISVWIWEIIHEMRISEAMRRIQELFLRFHLNRRAAIWIQIQFSPLHHWLYNFNNGWF